MRPRGSIWFVLSLPGKAACAFGGRKWRLIYAHQCWVLRKLLKRNPSSPRLNRTLGEWWSFAAATSPLPAFVLNSNGCFEDCPLGEHSHSGITLCGIWKGVWRWLFSSEISLGHILDLFLGNLRRVLSQSPSYLAVPGALRLTSRSFQHLMSWMSRKSLVVTAVLLCRNKIWFNNGEMLKWDDCIDLENKQSGPTRRSRLGTLDLILR